MKTILFFLSFIAIPLSFAQKPTLQHVEPPNWWVGMEHHQVEVLFHGTNIAALQIKTDLPIVGITKTENPNYQFVTFETNNVKAGTYPIQFLKGKKVVITTNYELKTRENTALKTSFSSADVVYLLMPDRFANGDESNDSSPLVYEKGNRTLPGGRHGGDIQGIQDHLDYIKELGATTIWPTPLLEDNDSTYSYHTYGQSDLYRIDPRYGTNESFKNFVNVAHQKELKVIQDVVPNHWGYMHWMMNDLPTHHWIHQFPGYAQSNYRMSTQMDTYAAQRDLKFCADGWFVRSMPDLNQSHPLVLNYLVQNSIWWIEYAQLDGFRVDTYSYNDKAGISKWTKEILNEYPWFNMVGEVWLHDQAQISYWQANSPIGALQSYNSHLPTVMDFTLHDALQNVFKESQSSWDQGSIKLYENFVNDFLYADPNKLLVFLENHDTQRFNELYHDIKAYKMGMTLIATIRGIPQIYYGSEIGMKGDKSKGDADIRRDFPGGWKSDQHNAFTTSGRTAEETAYFDFTKQLLNWRKTAIAVQQGTTKQFLPVNNVYVYFRMHEKQTVMVVINNSEKDQTINLENYQEVIKSFQTATEVFTKKAVSLKESMFTISAKTATIYELN